jgi:PilZ domain
MRSTSIEGSVMSLDLDAAPNRGGWAMENRRRDERQSAVWMGSCHVEGDPTDLWRDCGVFDVSARGVGLDLRYPDSSGLVGRRMSVRLPVGSSIDLTLTGEVRNTKPGPDGIVRAGFEYVDLSNAERAIVDGLEHHSPGGPAD